MDKTCVFYHKVSVWVNRAKGYKKDKMKAWLHGVPV